MSCVKTVVLKHGNAEDVAATVTDFLIGGGIVVMPMDTSYGIAADATNHAAVGAVIDIKGREPDKAISIVVEDLEEAERYAALDEQARRLWAALLPGPLTLVVPSKDGTDLVDAVTALGKTIGLRQPDHALTQLVAERFAKPYTATSANRSGNPPAYSADEFLATLPADKAPHLVVDGGQLPLGPSSTVVSVGESVEILRQGAVDANLVQTALGM